MTINAKPIVLASTSPYRAELLSRLNLPFVTAAPNIPEPHLPGEPPAQRAARLAKAKAEALAPLYPNTVLIGSDQVAAHEDRIFDKPGTEANAIETLLSLRGNTVNFYTAVCLVVTDKGANASNAKTCLLQHTDLTKVQVREDLIEQDIRRYVQADTPLNCAGAFKVESLGISLFEAVKTNDPTALIGLPLIAVAKGLRNAGYHVP